MSTHHCWIGDTGGRTACGIATGRGGADTAVRCVTRTRPHGVLYVVTGAGGSGRDGPEGRSAGFVRQLFTDRYVSNVTSFTAVEVDGRCLHVKQISARGEELDAFTVTK